MTQLPWSSPPTPLCQEQPPRRPIDIECQPSLQTWTPTKGDNPILETINVRKPTAMGWPAIAFISYPSHAHPAALWHFFSREMQLSPHAWPLEQGLHHPSTGIVDQRTGMTGRLMIDAGSTGMKMPAIANAAMIRNMSAPLPGEEKQSTVRADCRVRCRETPIVRDYASSVCMQGHQ
ncbi:hypothetical protein [Mesorhizobium shangrilense]|uniref:Uncharacterized protein n=1 Tax=Mesorhizobium shangrilense TaxID=460060 RepID=A0ABV2DFX3_9HYPH